MYRMAAADGYRALSFWHDTVPGTLAAGEQLRNRRAVGRNVQAEEYGGRRRRGPPLELEPLAERPSQPLPSPSDWTFEMIKGAVPLFASVKD